MPNADDLFLVISILTIQNYPEPPKLNTSPSPSDTKMSPGGALFIIIIIIINEEIIVAFSPRTTRTRYRVKKQNCEIRRV